MKVTFYKNNFYRIIGASPDVLHWLKYSVKPLYRFYKDGSWYLHKDFIDDAVKVASKTNDAHVIAITDDYAKLYLIPTAPITIVDAVYRALVKLHHPDKGGDVEVMKIINEAYQRIKNQGIDNA